MDAYSPNRPLKSVGQNRIAFFVEACMNHLWIETTKFDELEDVVGRAGERDR